MPGGALDEGESAVDGAVREFVEEIGDVLGEYRVVEVHQDDHGGWSYWTVIVEVAQPFPVPAEPANWETAEASWVSHAELDGLELLGAFRQTLMRLGLLGDT